MSSTEGPRAPSPASFCSSARCRLVAASCRLLLSQTARPQPKPKDGDTIAHLQRLGEYLRWGSSLAPDLSELAICLTARHLRASYEWHAHAPLAVEAGVPAAAIEAIRTGTTPSFTTTDQVLVHRVITELIDTKCLSDATFAEAIARLGEQGVVELGTIVGYYTAIGNALNIFQVPLPAGAPQPFP